jgi:hypothetical protein
MKPEHEQRLAQLREEYVSFQFIGQYYGISLIEPKPNVMPEILEDCCNWAVRHNLQPLGGPDTWFFSRLVWERYLQAHDAKTYRWAAAQIGMTEDSLCKVLKKLPPTGLQNHSTRCGLIVGDLKKDLLDFLPGMKHKFFRDYSVFCQKLHMCVEESLGVHVEPLYCATSVAIKEEPLRFAHDFDCITLMPLGLTHQVWLKLGKPLSLPPDRCSKLFYVRNSEQLRPLLITSREPDDLEKYKIPVGGNDDA